MPAGGSSGVPGLGDDDGIKVVPARDDVQPEWPTTVSWHVLDSRRNVVFAGDTNLDTAQDLGWRRPLQMRELTFDKGVWRTGERLNPDEVYRLRILSADGTRRRDQFVIDMYYFAPLRLQDSLPASGHARDSGILRVFRVAEFSLPEELLHVDHEEMFSVRRDNEANAYYLDVVCGGIAMFERRLTLNAEEADWFRNDPQQFLTLVRQVRKWPERFQGRISSV